LQNRSDGWILRVPGAADFFVDHEFRNVRIDRVEDLCDEDLEHLLIDQILPRVLAQMGELIVHAAAIELGGWVGLFVGPTGRGKSTLCAALANRGLTILSDDCVVVRVVGPRVQVLPTYPSLRLLSDSAETFFGTAIDVSSLFGYNYKKRMPLPSPLRPIAFHTVGAVYLLHTRDNERSCCTVTRTSASAACIGVLTNSFRLDPTDTAQGAELFRTAAEVARQVPTFKLDLPGTLSVLHKNSAPIAEQLIACRAGAW
jgi:hypothetical protein